VNREPGRRARTTLLVREAAGALARRVPEARARRVPPALATLTPRRPRGGRALAAGLTALAVALVIAIAVGLGGGGHPARTVATAPRMAALPGTATRAARWLAGPAGRLLSAVSADLGRLSAAQRSAKPGPARLAGLRLTTDAKAALLGPAPPRAARLYRAALTDLERAGRSAASGRLRAAGASLRAGEAAITKVTAIANTPAPAGSAAPVREPAGQ
jgi:hypothetical protein